MIYRRLSKIYPLAIRDRYIFLIFMIHTWLLIYGNVEQNRFWFFFFNQHITYENRLTMLFGTFSKFYPFYAVNARITEKRENWISNFIDGSNRVPPEVFFSGTWIGFRHIYFGILQTCESLTQKSTNISVGQKLNRSDELYLTYNILESFCVRFKCFVVGYYRGNRRYVQPIMKSTNSESPNRVFPIDAHRHLMMKQKPPPLASLSPH